MPTYQVRYEGQTFEVKAPSLIRATSAARLLVARQRMTTAAREGAERRSNTPRPNAMLDFLSRASGVGSQEDREKLLQTRAMEREGAVRGGAVGLAATAALPLVGGLITAPVATATALGTGAVGSEVGSRGGRTVGRTAERLGAPQGTAAALEAAGGLGGGLVGGLGGVRGLQALRGVAASPTERAVLETLARRVAAGEAAPVTSEARAATVAAREAQVAPSAATAQGAPSVGKTWQEVGIQNYYGRGPFPTDAEWAKMGGSTAKRAWLESRGIIPEAARPQDVVSAIKRGATADELEAMFPPGAPWAKAAQQAVGQAPKVASPGAVRAAQHNRLMAFAKDAATKSKLGQKIWVELDEAGAPVRVLTPDAAAAAKRAGRATTWVRNLWDAA